MTAVELYQAGQLNEAITAQTAAVKAKPADPALRSFLAELLCFNGDLERADKQLDAAGGLDPTIAVGAQQFRQLIRAETARQQFYSSGRVPEFLDQPSPEMQLRLEASIELREGNRGRAAELLGQAEVQRPPLGGKCDGQPFDDLRDLDDLTASCFEVLTHRGTYCWFAMDEVQSIEFQKPEFALDALWRPARLATRAGLEMQVHLPALYPGSARAEDPRLRLGRETDWLGGEEGPVRGVGQRMLLIGEDARPFLTIGKIVIEE